MKGQIQQKAIITLLIAFAMSTISVAGVKNDTKILARPSAFTNRGIQKSSIKSANVQIPDGSGAHSISSTVVFEEDFESAYGFPPAGWKTVNADGGGSTGPWFAGNISVLTALSRDSYAAANYQGANELYIDEWLISPAISALSSQDTLLFWHRSPDDSPWYDSIEVRISTSDTAIGSFTTLVDYFKTSTDGWAQNRYPLGNYIENGNPIYIAFRYLIYDGGSSGMNSDYVGIDLVRIVRPQVANDIQVLSIDYPQDGSKVIAGQSIEPVVTFQNVGTVVQPTIPIRVKIIPPTGITYESNQAIANLAPGITSQIVFDSYTPTATGIYKIRGYSYLPGDQNTTNDSLTALSRGSVVLSGVFTVGAGGNIRSLKSAVDTLNHNIIGGNVTLSLVDNVYVEPPLSLGSLDYVSSPNRILLKPAPGVSPTISIQATSAEQFGFALTGAPFVTFDGSNSTKNYRNTIIRVLGEYGKTGILIGGTDQSFADSNVIKNLKIETAADTLSDADGYYGALLLGFDPSLKDYGNTVANCEITNHGAAGIAVQWQEGVVIENNFIHDWKQVIGENNVHGIMNADGACKTIIRGNTIGNLRTADNYAWAVGIENSAGEGSNISVYNNIVYNILSYGAGTNTNRSIGLFGSSYFNNSDVYCYNSIYLSGTDLSSSGLSRTAGVELAGGSNITVVNNIIYNESVLSASAEENKAYGIYLLGLHTNFISNHNIFYIPLTQGVVGYNDGVRQVLTDWSSSFDPEQDDSSAIGNPQFISKVTGNLHVNPAIGSPANAAGTPIAGITRDIDGNPRSTVTPDIGADEFTPGGATVQQEYATGWNLVSIPLTVDSYERSELFPGSVSEAFSYNGRYDAEETIRNGPGYWLKFGEAAIVNFVGLPRSTDTVSVLKGWNLVGSISDSVSTAAIIEIPSGIVLSDYYLHDDGYIAVEILAPGKGYWVKVSQDGELILK
jgi:hypothetical protein